MHARMRWGALGIAGTLAVGMLGMWSIAQPATHAGGRAAEKAARTLDRWEPVDRRPRAMKARLAAQDSVEAPSLAGTDVDGALAKDDRGRFVATEDALRMFEYFLSTRGERTDAEIDARIAREAEKRASDVDAVLALLARYRAYREELARRVARLPPGDMRAALAATQAAQAQIFGDDAPRLFASEDAEATRFVSEAEIRSDPALDEGTRAARLAALDEALPPDLRAIRADRDRVMREVEARVRAAGAGN